MRQFSSFITKLVLLLNLLTISYCVPVTSEVLVLLPSIPQKISLKKAVAHTENKEEPHTYRFQLQRGLRATKSSATYQAHSKPYSTLDPHQITTEMRKQMKK